MSLTPAERYARAKARQGSPEVERFRALQEFDLDPFQRDACASLEAGNSVLVAAPTGAGKTIVAEFAVHLALRDPRAKVFYTTPMKALSNQKYSELAAEHGIPVHAPDEPNHQIWVDQIREMSPDAIFSAQ